MTCNYRLIDFGDHLALHEVYYDDAGNPRAYTNAPASFVAEAGDVNKIRGGLARALSDASTLTVLSAASFGTPLREKIAIDWRPGASAYQLGRLIADIGAKVAREAASRSRAAAADDNRLRR